MQSTHLIHEKEVGQHFRTANVLDHRRHNDAVATTAHRGIHRNLGLCLIKACLLPPLLRQVESTLWGVAAWPSGHRGSIWLGWIDIFTVSEIVFYCEINVFIYFYICRKITKNTIIAMPTCGSWLFPITAIII